jgi:ribosomal protein S27E
MRRKELYIEEAIKRGKCPSCGDIEWLFDDGKGGLICGICKQTIQLMEKTMRKN